MSLERRYVDRVIATARDAGVDIPPEVMAIQHMVEHGAAPIDAWLAANPGRTEDDADALAAGCCMGQAVYGVRRCTCWEPVYDCDQAEPVLPVPAGSITVRPGGRCGDCAFRKDSPERAELWSEEELLGLAVAGEPFWCHDGMRRPAFYEHPKLGRVSGSTADWRPPQLSGVPFKRDGSPGFLCAGWAQEVRRQERLSG